MPICKNILHAAVIFGLLSVSACNKQTVYAPVQKIGEEDIKVSRDRVKMLNTSEREYIEQWILASKTPYYTMAKNYWTSTQDLSSRNRLPDGKKVSYSYYLWDFAGNQIYPKPKGNKDAVLGRFQELDAVDDAIRYMKPGEETTLLVPSALAYGTYGDENLIPHDFPLVIKLQLISHEN